MLTDSQYQVKGSPDEGLTSEHHVMDEVQETLNTTQPGQFVELKSESKIVILIRHGVCIYVPHTYTEFDFNEMRKKHVPYAYKFLQDFIIVNFMNQRAFTKMKM